MTFILMQVQPVQWLAGGGARHVRVDPAGRVCAGAVKPAAEVRGHGGCPAERHEAYFAHAGHGSVHGVHSQSVRRTGAPAAGHPVQPVDVQRAGVHARRAADPRVAGRGISAAVELQHEVLRVAERQVPGRRSAPVRRQSVLPEPERPERSAAAPADRQQPAAAFM